MSKYIDSKLQEKLDKQINKVEKQIQVVQKQRKEEATKRIESNLKNIMPKVNEFYTEHLEDNEIYHTEESEKIDIVIIYVKLPPKPITEPKSWYSKFIDDYIGSFQGCICKLGRIYLQIPAKIWIESMEKGWDKSYWFRGKFETSYDIMGYKRVFGSSVEDAIKEINKELRKQGEDEINSEDIMESDIVENHKLEVYSVIE